MQGVHINMIEYGHPTSSNICFIYVQIL